MSTETNFSIILKKNSSVTFFEAVLFYVYHVYMHVWVDLHRWKRRTFQDLGENVLVLGKCWKRCSLDKRFFVEL